MLAIRSLNICKKFTYLQSFQLETLRRCKNTSSQNYDVAVIGGGIVGVASAREMIMRHPNLKIVILEKEKNVAFHQSGHNSGVIHAGIYYKPGSLKAKLCVEGLKLSYEYLAAKNIPYKKCGKLIVAIHPSEVKSLEDLYKRGQENGVPDLKMIPGDEIEAIEPYCEGVQALWSPLTGIVDWGLVTKQYGNDFMDAGGEILLNFEVKFFREAHENVNYPIIISDGIKDEIRAKYVLACCGLQSDLVAVMTGCSPNPKVIPFRGEYLLLEPSRSFLVQGNIYPVPDPRFPFLGVHFTPRMDGSVLLGPNAVLAFKREGYRWGDINLSELAQIIKYPGFRKMARKYVRFGLTEMIRSAILPLQIQQLQKYVPMLSQMDVSPGPSGVRAQAMDTDGSLIEDFVFDCRKDMGAVGSRVLHCRNAPSPAATSSLAIAKMIADKMEQEFKL